MKKNYLQYKSKDNSTVISSLDEKYLSIQDCRPAAVAGIRTSDQNSMESKSFNLSWLFSDIQLLFDIVGSVFKHCPLLRADGSRNDELYFIGVLSGDALGKEWKGWLL